MKKLMFVLTVAVMFAFSATAVMADPGPYSPQCADDNGGVFSACEAGNGFDIFNAVNKVFTDRGLASPGHTKNEDTDGIQITTQNEFWQQLATEDSSEFAFISITAANTNQLGVYPTGGNAAASTFFPLSFTGTKFTGNGSAGNPYPGFVNPLADQNFGFSLKSTPDVVTTNNPVQVWASEVAQNVDGIDHMLAFQLEALAGQTINIQIDGNNDGDLDDLEDEIVEITLMPETFLIAWEDKKDGLSTFDSDYNDAIFLVTKIKPTIVPEPMSMLLFGSGIAALAGTRRKRKIS